MKRRDFLRKALTVPAVVAVAPLAVNAVSVGEIEAAKLYADRQSKYLTDPDDWFLTTHKIDGMPSIKGEFDKAMWPGIEKLAGRIYNNEFESEASKRAGKDFNDWLKGA